MNETTAPVTVHQAWAAVMGDMRELAKGERNTAPNANYNFRGIDAVMNAVGPVLRRHQVSVIPTRVTSAHRDVQTSTGKPSREATVEVGYTIIGPAGDVIEGASAGEAMDSGDKGTPKAMSVAFRTFLLQALCLPTHDTDPDAQTYERAVEPTPEELTAQVLQGIADATTEAEVREWGNRAHGRGLLTPELSAKVQARLAEVAAA